MHSSLLDVTVRTGPSLGPVGVLGGCVLPPCRRCGRRVMDCVCV